jgi:phage terminase large subunit
MDTVAATKNLSAGIQAVASRLKVAGDGKARLFLLRDALVERDPALDEKKLPACCEEELDGYIWNLTSGRKKGEEPVDKDNHGADCLRYMCAHLDLKQRPQGFAPRMLGGATPHWMRDGGRGWMGGV